MHTPELGQLITGPAERDAIHVAVVPLIAGEELRPGDPVRLKPGTTDVALRGTYNDRNEPHSPRIGIVDPFIDPLGHLWIREGTRFWCLLYPGTVTAICHDWQHPAFIERKVGSESEQWLLDFAAKWNFRFDEMIDAAVGRGQWEPGDDDDGPGEFDRCRYVVARGRDLHSASDLDDGEESLFWSHLEAYTGQVFSEEHRRGMGWSCSC